jgi:subtilisin family serine protease
LFKDKTNTGYFLEKPEEFLSKKSLLRREKNQVQLNEQDLPVNSNYLKELTALGAKVLYPLKWLNGAMIQMTPSLKNKVLANEHVKGFYYPFAVDSAVANNPNAVHKGALTYTKENTEILYGSSNTQIVQIGIDHMHKAGITGNDVLITLLDDGYLNTPSLPIFKNLVDEKRIVSTMATSPDRKTVFEKGKHGTNVLSVIAGYSDNNIIGGAYKAKIALVQTEESEWEKLVEEVNWMRGAEWADSLGTDIISSSLGYSQFDLSIYNHQYNQLNGNATLVTKAANWATDRGITCVVSAGNEGSTSWKYITAPADALDILSVGAVSSSSIKIAFSSLGPTSDGRLKPDVCALGSGVRAAETDGSFGYYSGTSFSAPLVSSLVAGLMEQYPKLKASAIRDIIRKSSSIATSPTNFLGYGVPSYEKAVELISPVLETKAVKEQSISIYPNPVEIGGNLHLSSSQKMPYEVEILNIQGQVIQQFNWEGEEKNISLGPIRAGKYFFRIKSASLMKIIPIIVY